MRAFISVLEYMPLVQADRIQDDIWIDLQIAFSLHSGDRILLNDCTVEVINKRYDYTESMYYVLTRKI
jgi:hypothetical protein